jgi:hypothetical protein
MWTVEYAKRFLKELAVLPAEVHNKTGRRLISCRF